ncbi:MAG: cobalt-precorrin-6A reductase [Roseibium sp.]|nr:cobalt-precorrin-6A reductase [Roseibium sp.]
MDERIDILILGGTHEARILAGLVRAKFPDLATVVSFAGAVTDLPDLDVPVRIGGFGGSAGLAAFLKDHHVRLLVDATHPFARQMSGNAAQASEQAKVPLLRMERPAWQPAAGDRWQSVPDVSAANAALPPGARVFLAIGRKEAAVFCDRSDLSALVRMIEHPGFTLPAHWRLVLSRPSQSVDEEVRLLRDNQISHIVCKNSGGERSHAKIEAARRLTLPVIMIDRPALPAVRVCPNPAETAVEMERLLRTQSDADG